MLPMIKRTTETILPCLWCLIFLTVSDILARKRRTGHNKKVSYQNIMPFVVNIFHNTQRFESMNSSYTI